MIVNAPSTFQGSATLVATPKQIQRTRASARTAPAMSVLQRGALRGSHVVFAGARTFVANPHINGNVPDTNERGMSRPFVDRAMNRPFIDRTMTRPATE